MNDLRHPCVHKVHRGQRHPPCDVGHNEGMLLGGKQREREVSIARQVFILQFVVVLVMVVAASGLAVYDARRDVRSSAAERSTSVASSVADSPDVRRAVAGRDPTRSLQPFAERVRADTAVDFVVVMALDRTRYTHPEADRIGKKFVGDLGGAPQGEVFVQEYIGTLGPSVRAVAPVFDASSNVIALVSVGITLDHVAEQLRGDLLVIALAAGLVLAVGYVGVGLVSRRLRKATHGMGEHEITRMYEYYSAVLHAVREGLLLLDREGVIQLANDEAHRLLDLPQDAVGSRLDSLGLPPGLVSAATGETPQSDDIYLTGDFVLVVSSSPARWRGSEVGAVVTLRDHTELQEVIGELTVNQVLADSLRALHHESANRLHTVVSLIETGRGREAVEFATKELHLAQRLTDRIMASSTEPVLAALLVAKAAQAAEAGVDFAVTGGMPEPFAVPSRDLVTILGNLIDNALDAVAGREDRRVLCDLGATSTSSDTVRISVSDSGPGVPQGDVDRILGLGWTTKVQPGVSSDGWVGGHRGIGLALVARTARRYGGGLEVNGSRLGGAEFVVTLQVLAESWANA